MTHDSLHINPSLSELLAYKRGNLRADQAEHVRRALENNAMLLAVYEQIENLPISQAGKISEKANQQILKRVGQSASQRALQYRPIILSSFAVLVIAALVFWLLGGFSGSSLAQYTPNNTVAQLSSVQPEQSGASTDAEQQKEISQNLAGTPSKNGEIGQKKEESAHPNDKGEKGQEEQNKSESEIDKIEKQAPKQASLALNNQNAALQLVEQPAQPQEKKTEDVPRTQPPPKRNTDESSVSKYEKGERVTLNIISSKLMMKQSLAQKKDSKNAGGSGGSPHIGSKSGGEQAKRYKAEDLPKFRSGDDGLMNFFKGAIGTVPITFDPQYNHNFYLRFMINNRGKVGSWSIMGNVAPEVKAKVKEAMNQMPRWSKANAIGKKGKVECMVAISLK